MSDTGRVGVEEEFFVVDAETHAVMRRMPRGFFEKARERLGGRLKGELLQSQVETATVVHRGMDEARADLKAMRVGLAESAAEYGLAVLACGTHPTALWATQRASDERRSEALMEDLQMLGLRNIVCGLHVHAEFAEPERRVEIMGRILPFVPLLVALSTSSPFWQARATGLMGYRLAAYDELPRTGLPELFQSQAEYDAYVATLVEAGAIKDASFVWWAVRPSLKFPTLELRAPDACTDIEDGLTIAALYRCLVRRLLRDPDLNGDLSAVSRALAQENKWRAQRYGVSGSLICEKRRKAIPIAEVVEEVTALVAEDAEALGCVDEVDRARTIVSGGASADRQLTVWGDALRVAETPHDALRAVKGWIAAATIH